MRDLPEGLRDLAGRSVTTLATVWRLVRADGRVFGFTDHDEDLAFAGTVFRARTGWTAGEAEAELGLAAGSAGVEGAFASGDVREEEIAAGLFDGARIDVFRVDWQAPEHGHVLMEVADLGEVTRDAGGFRAELRGLAARLDRTHGRRYRRRCDARLGDARCGVDLSREGRSRTGTVLNGDRGVVLLGDLGAIDPSRFQMGRVTFPDGRSFAVRALEPGREPGSWRVVTLGCPPADAKLGMQVELTIGCDLGFATCRDRFGNAANFRGFPHLPGSDAALGVAKRDQPHDGQPWVP